MATVQSEKILSISHIARATGLDRRQVGTILEIHEPELRIFRSKSLVYVLSEYRTALIDILKKHPGVRRGFEDDL